MVRRRKISRRRAKRMFKKTAMKRLRVNDAFGRRGGLSL